jgi:sporulation integral membrane protein YtvI
LYKWFLPLILAYVTAWLTKPMTRFLNNKWKFPPKIAAIVSLIVHLLLVLAVITAISARIISELIRLAANIPNLIVAAQDFFGSSSDNFLSLQQKLSPELAKFLDQSAAAITQQGLSSLGNIASGLVPKVMSFITAIPGSFIFLLIYLISSIFICMDYDNINIGIRKMLTAAQFKKISQIRSHTTGALSKYLRGMAIIYIMDFIIFLVGFMILGVDYAFLLALFLSFMDVLPMIGTGIVLNPWGIIAIVSGNVTQGIGLIVLYVVLTIIRQLTEPKIMSSQLGLRPIVTITSAYVGLQVFGAVGVIIMPIITLIIYSLYRSGLFDGLRKIPQDLAPSKKERERDKNNGKKDKE